MAAPSRRPSSVTAPSRFQSWSAATPYRPTAGDDNRAAAETCDRLTGHRGVASLLTAPHRLRDQRTEPPLTRAAGEPGPATLGRADSGGSTGGTDWSSG